jgi:hypothetical protein
MELLIHYDSAMYEQAYSPCNTVGGVVIYRCGAASIQAFHGC